MYLLDTNACIVYLNSTDPGLVERVLSSGPRALAVSALTVGELHLGAERSSRRGENRQRLSLFFSELEIVPFGESCAEVFGQLKAQLLRKGRPIPDFDIAIAATAIVSERVLVSADAHMQEIPDLALTNWATDF